MKTKKTRKTKQPKVIEMVNYLPADLEPNVIEITTVATEPKVIEVAAVVTIPRLVLKKD